MDCGYLRAGVLVGVGAALRTVIAGSILRAIGLGTGLGDGTDVIRDTRSLLVVWRGLYEWFDGILGKT